MKSISAFLRTSILAIICFGSPLSAMIAPKPLELHYEASKALVLNAHFGQDQKVAALLSDPSAIITEEALTLALLNACSIGLNFEENGSWGRSNLKKANYPATVQVLLDHYPQTAAKTYNGPTEKYYGETPSSVLASTKYNIHLNAHNLSHDVATIELLEILIKNAQKESPLPKCYS